jgi:predicted HTH domain antitoxin
MAALHLNVPEELLTRWPDLDTLGRELRLAAAFYWCRRGELSTSEAARLAELSYSEFLEAAAQRHAVLYDYDIAEVRDELDRDLPEGTSIDSIKQDIARAQSDRR